MSGFSFERWIKIGKQNAIIKKNKIGFEKLFNQINVGDNVEIIGEYMHLEYDRKVFEIFEIKEKE